MQRCRTVRIRLASKWSARTRRRSGGSSPTSTPKCPAPSSKVNHLNLITSTLIVIVITFTIINHTNQCNTCWFHCYKSFLKLRSLLNNIIIKLIDMILVNLNELHWLNCFKSLKKLKNNIILVNWIDLFAINHFKN